MRLLPSVGRGSRKSLGLTLLLYISLERLHVLGRTSSCVFGGQRRNQRHQFDPPSSFFLLKHQRPPSSPLFPFTALFRSGCIHSPGRFECKDGWSLILNDLDGGF